MERKKKITYMPAESWLDLFQMSPVQRIQGKIKDSDNSERYYVNVTPMRQERETQYDLLQ